jgi:hypothetical protein
MVKTIIPIDNSSSDNLPIPLWSGITLGNARHTFGNNTSAPTRTGFFILSNFLLIILLDKQNLLTKISSSVL